MLLRIAIIIVAVVVILLMNSRCWVQTHPESELGTMKTLQVVIEDEVHARLKTAAGERKLSLGDHVREVLGQAVKGNPAKKQEEAAS